MKNKRVKNMELKEMIIKFLKFKRIYSSVATVRFYESHLNTVFDFFKDKEINGTTLYDFILSQKSRGNKNSTINKRVMVLKVLMRWSNVYIEDLEKFKKLREVKKTFEFFDEAKLNRIFNYIWSSKQMKFANKLMIQLLFETGMRRNEIVNVQVEDVDLQNNLILLKETKTKKERYVPFSDFTKELLINYMGVRKKGNLFNITSSSVSDCLVRIKKRLNLEKFHAHMFRHTFATYMLRKGCDLKTLQMILGHSNLSTTERYLHCDVNNIISTFRRCFDFNGNGEVKLYGKY